MVIPKLSTGLHRVIHIPRLFYPCSPAIRTPAASGFPHRMARRPLAHRNHPSVDKGLCTYPQFRIVEIPTVHNQKWGCAHRFSTTTPLLSPSYPHGFPHPVENHMRVIHTTCSGTPSRRPLTTFPCRQFTHVFPWLPLSGEMARFAGLRGSQFTNECTARKTLHHTQQAHPRDRDKRGDHHTAVNPHALVERATSQRGHAGDQQPRQHAAGDEPADMRLPRDAAH